MNRLLRTWAFPKRKNAKPAEVLPEKYSARLSYTALESRIAFDGAAVAEAAAVMAAEPAGAENGAAPADGEHQATDAKAAPHGSAEAADHSDAHDIAAESSAEQDADDLWEAAAMGPQPNESQTTIVFVDQNVENFDQIVAGIDPSFEIILIDGNSSGLEQIAANLEGRTDVASIHIVSHGEAGRLFLGTDVLDLGTITGPHAETLATIGSALAADGDILLYGCDVADGVTGLEFMEALSDITGADIAASVDDTGDPTRGGNWTLERSVGSIETSSIYIDSYNGILSQNNTGSWSVTGTTATNTTAGVTTTVSFGSYSNATTIVRNVVNDNLSNLAIFNPGGVQNTASLAFEYAWDTTPEGGATEASVDAGTGIVTITFSQAVTNPIIHLDRLGGSDGAVQNSASLTLLTSGVTLSRLSGTSHFSVNATTGVITNSQVDVAIGGGFSGETSTTANAGTAGGSVQVVGTVTTIQFRLSAAPNANEGAGADAIELKVTLDPSPTAANDTFTTVHDTPVTINVRSNDSDVNNDALTVTQVNGTAITSGGAGVSVTGGVVTLNASGDLVFTPNANYAGSPSFTYTVADANGGSSTATVSGTVTNHAPVVDLNSTPTPVMTTDTTTSTSTSNLVTNGTFPTNGPAAAGWTEGGTDDGLVVNGRYVWVDGPGTLAQNLTVLDPTTDTTVSTTSTATTRTVTTTTITTVDAVSSISFDMAYQNADLTGANDNRLTVSYNGVTYAVFETAEGGLVGAAGTWTYFNGASGPASVNGVANEETGATTAITIGLPNGITSSGQLLFSYGNGSTGDGSDDLAIDNVVVTSTRTTTTTVDTATTTTDTANNGWAATYQENGSPVSIADTDSSIFDGDDSNIEAANITLSNPQTGDRLLVGGSSASSGTIGPISWTRTNSVVMFSGTATAAQYANAIESVQFENTTDTPATVARTINVTVNDGISNSSTAVATITIDSAPDPTNDAFSGNEDTAISGNVLANDSDRGDTPITSVTVASSPANGTLTSFNTSTGAFVYTPNANFNGTDTFTYTLTDADGDTKTATVTLTVTPVNDAPVNIVPGARTTAEDTPLAITGVSVSDVDSASLTTTLSVPSGSGVLGIVSGSGATISGAGTATVTITGTPAQINAAIATITYTPIADFNGATTLTVSTSDGVAAATSSSVAISVTAVADILNDTVTTNEDTAVTFAPLGNDSFENAGRTITAINGTAITAGGASVAVTGGSVALNVSGTLTYTPNANFNGTPSFTYTVTSGGVTETATVNVTVTAVNDAPVQNVPGAQSTAEDTALSISGVSVSDVDNASLTTTLSIPLGSGALSVVTGSGATVTSSGGGTTVTLSGTAAQINAALVTITYTPTADYNGSALLTVSTNDGTATTANTVAITVTSVADITNDAITTSEDTARSFNVLTGTNGATADTFENGGAAVTSVTQPTNGSVTFAANGAISYTPAANFNGSDSFTYTVTSGGVTETATVTVSVTAVNDAPVNSVPASQSTSEDTNVVFSTANGNAISVVDVDSSLTTTLSIANGTLTLGSVSGVTVSGNGTGTVTVSGTPAQISAALNGLSFAPTADWNGSTTLNVSTSDGVAAAVNNTVQINVAAVADIVADSSTTAEDTARTFNVLTNDNFENAGRLVTSVTQPAHGSVSFLGNGQVTYTPTANYNGADSFTYTVTSGGVTETTTVTLTVTPVNDAPVAAGASITTAEDTARSGSLPVASDVDGDTVTYAKASDPAHGTVVVNSNGTYTYTPAANYNGADSFTYTVSDGNGGSNTYTVAINVTPVNDAPVAAGASITTAEDTARSGSLPVASDVDGDTVTYAKASDPAHGTVVVNSNGTYTYTPAANYNGADSFTYTVSDGNGGSNTYTVAINVTPVNDAPVAAGASITTAEDTARSGSLPVASDVDGDTVTYAKASDPAHGTVVVNSNGTYTYTPAANYNGADSFTYTVSDGNGGSNTYTVAINVTPVNDAPVAAGASITTAEDTARSGSLPVASDVDGDTVTYSKASDPAHGTVVVNSNGTYTYTPAANYNGADSFTYTVSDGNGGSNTYTVAINVTPVNDAPVAAGASITTAEDTARSGSLPVASDVDGDTVTYSKASDPAHGTVVVNSNGTYTYTPAANYNGADSFTYTVSDGNGGSNTYTVAINVTPVNDAPVAAGTSITTAEDTPRSGSLPVASDVDGDTVTYAKASDPANGTVVVNSNGTYTYTPAANYNGADSFTYTVSDGNGGSNTYTVAVNVTPVNDAPVGVAPAPRSDVDAGAVTYNVSGQFSDVDGDALTYSTTGLPSGLSINSVTGVISGTINGHASQGGVGGVYTVNVTATDAFGASVTRSFTWTVTNPAPVAGSDSFTGEEGTSISGNVLANDSDPDGDALTVSTVPVSGPSNGTLVLNSNGTFTYTPNATYNGTDSFTYRVTDADGASTTQTVTLTVTPVNDGPVVTAPSTQSTAEDSPLTFSSVNGNAITVGDVDSASVTTTLTVGHGSLTLGSLSGVTVSGNGTSSVTVTGSPTAVTAALNGLRYANTPDYFGSDTLMISSNDGIETATKSVDISITPVADIVADSVATNEDASISFNVLTGANGASADTFEGAPTVTAFTQPANGFVTISSGGSVTYSPNTNYNGVDSFTYTVTSGGVTETTTVTVTVVSVNDAPVASGTSITTAEDTARSGSLPVASDVDGDTVTYAKASDPAHGTVVVNSNGTYTYTPAANYNGADSFTYTVSDGNGGSNTYTVAINVTPVNDAPVAAGASITTAEDTARSGSLPVASDVDGDTVTYAKASDPAHGTVVVNSNGTYTYTPAANYNGADSFTYTVSDGNGGSNTYTVAVNVTPVNDAPVAAGASITTAEDTARSGSLPVASDVDGDTVTYSKASDPANGTVVVNSNGTYTYTPAANYNGADSFTYTVSDGNGGSNTYTVAVNVTPVNDAPVAAGASITTAEDTARSGSLPVASDVDGDTVTYAKASDPANGTVVINSNGTYTYTPAANYNGADSFTYTVSDGNGGSNTYTVAINVTPVNDAPVLIVPSAQAGTEDVSVVFSSANGNQITVSDVDSGSIVETSISVPTGTLTLGTTAGVTILSGANGSATLTISGTPAAVTAALNGLIYAPVSDAHGTVTLTVSTTDGVADAQSSTIAMTFAPVVDIANDSATTNEDSARIISVLTNDTFENSDRAVTAVSSPANGTIVNNGDGTVTYTPNANFNGTDSFTYTVTSGGVTETATVTVIVAPVNDAPMQSVPLAQTTSEDVVLTFSSSNGNAIAVADIDGDALTTTVSVTNGALTLGSTAGVSVSGNGTATITVSGTSAAINAALNGLSYSATADYNGTAALTVTTSDGSVASSDSIPISVTPVVDIVSDTVSTNEDAPITFNVLANDTFENAGASVTSVSQGAMGTVTIGSGGQITYSPNANANGSDSFSYTVTSGGGTETTTVTVNIVPINDAPVTVVPGSQSTNEDVDLVFSVARGNAITIADVDGDIITVTLSGTNGTLTLGSTLGVSVTGSGTETVVVTGSASAITAALNGLAYASSDDYNGSAIINVTTTDGTVTQSRMIAVTIVPVADIVANSASTTEDTPVTINVLANDSFESPARAVTNVTQGSSGTVAFMSDGTVTYTPNLDFTGTDSFTYTVTSGGVIETTTVTVSVGAVNDVPTTTGISDASHLDGEVVNIDISASFADEDGDTLTYSAMGLPLGLSIDPVSGVISGTVDRHASQGGPYSVVVTASDGNPGGDVSTAFTWSIANPAPTASDDSATVSEDASQTISVLVNDVDPDFDALTVTSATAGNGIVTINGDGTLTYTPALNFNGSDTIVYQISDGDGGTSTATVNVVITPVNDAPVAAGASITTAEDTARSGSLPVASDVDGDTVTYAKASDPAHGTVVVNSNGTYTYTPAANYNGADSFTYTVSDGNGGSNTYTVAINVTPVNDAPVAAGASITTAEDTARSGSLPVASDVDGDTVTYAKASDPAHGTVVVNSNGTYTYTPAANYNGADSFTYTVSDGNGGSNTYTVAINVTPVNDAPVAAGASITTAEDTARSGSLPVASDVDGDTVTYSKASDPAHGTVVVNSNGTYTYTPAANYNGADSFTYTVSDGNGGSNTYTVAINVTPVNDAPVASGTSITTAEDTARSGSLPVASDVDGDTVTYAKASDPGHGTVVVNSNGTYTYTPAANYNGTDSFTYTVSDGNGGSNTYTVAINVTPVNDAPVAAGASITTAEDTARSGSLPVASDVDGDTVTYAKASDPANGTVVVNSNGTYTYTPAANYNGPDSFTYTVSDGNGGSNTYTVAINVTPVNDAPVAVNDSFTGSEDTPLTGDVTPGTPTQDRDVDGDMVTVVDDDGDMSNGITPVVGPTNGTLVLNASGTFSYTPNANFHGSDSFTYRITDGNGAFSNATVTLTVVPVNDAPVAANGSLTTPEDQAFTGVLPVATDVDGDSLTYGAGATAPQHGSVVINSNGTYTYVPASNHNGSDSFTYVVRDGVATVERTVTVLITPLNDAPTFTPITAPISADSANVQFDLSRFVVNIDGDSIVYTATGLPPGLSIDPATGVVSGTLPHDASQGGPYVVTLTVDDGQGGVATSSFTWQVNNPTPIARNDAIAIDRNVAVVVPVLANDVDPDGDQLSVISASAQTGTVEVLADGSIRYTPRSDFNGRDTVTYRIADGNGGFAQATVTITVGSDLYVEQDEVFGFNGPETVANKDRVQYSPYETISADGAVLEAVFNIGSLNSLAEQLSSDGAVISAANSVASLGGIGSLGTSGIVIDTIRIERAREIAFSAGFDRSHLEPRLEGLPGFSLRHNVPGNLDGLSAREQVVIESLVRDQTLIVQISNTIENGVRRITEYRITQVDGSALPEWLDQIGPDLLMGRHDAGSDDIELRIEAIYSDGTSVVENVRIDAGTGEISPLAAPAKDAAAPQMFGDQFRAQHMLTPEQIQGLGQSIAP